LLLLYKIPHGFNHPTELIMPNGERVHETLPECSAKFHYTNAVGLSYEAEAVREAIGQGLLEHPRVTHENSRVIMHIMDEARRQLGYLP
jgi:hypothetical protein